jgi:vitamin B12 transporter
MHIILFFALILLFLPALADPLELVITPTRSETPIGEVGSSITVITADDIARKQGVNVADMLRGIQGVDVAQSGGPGQQTSVFMRGANSEHTLVLIDGVKANDPNSPNGAYDFSRLTTDNIERIEVLRGNESVLYGSNAIGGVINIITKKGIGAPSAWASAEGGSYDTYKVASGVLGKINETSFSFDASRFGTGGIAEFDKTEGAASHHDGYDYSNFSGRVDGKINEWLSASSSMRYNDSRTTYDEDLGVVPDTFYLANNFIHAKEFAWNGTGIVSLLNGTWKQEFSANYYSLHRNIDDQVYGSIFYHGERVELSWLNHIKLAELNTLTLGAETNQEIANTNNDNDGAHDQRINGYFVQEQIGITKDFYTTIGARLDDNNQFGNKATYRIAQVYTVPETKTQFKASYGTGFKAPSLFQLYDTYSGNLALKPETSTGYDIGFEQPLLKDHLRVGSTFFHTNFTNLITFGPAPTFQNININAARVNGVENFVQWTPLPSLSLKAQYTYTDAYDAGTGLELLRRAKNKASLDADYTFLERGRAGVNIIFNGTRSDSDFYGSRIALPNSATTNLTGSWQLTDSIQLFGRIDNLFDKQYENVYGFGTAGVSGYAGIKAQY